MAMPQGTSATASSPFILVPLYPPTTLQDSKTFLASTGPGTTHLPQSPLYQHAISSFMNPIYQHANGSFITDPSNFNVAHVSAMGAATTSTLPVSSLPNLQASTTFQGMPLSTKPVTLPAALQATKASATIQHEDSTGQ